MIPDNQRLWKGLEIIAKIKAAMGLCLDLEMTDSIMILHLNNDFEPLRWHVTKSMSADENVSYLMSQLNTPRMDKIIQGRISLIDREAKDAREEKERLAVFLQHRENLP